MVSADAEIASPLPPARHLFLGNPNLTFGALRPRPASDPERWLTLLVNNRPAVEMLWESADPCEELTNRFGFRDGVATASPTSALLAPGGRGPRGVVARGPEDACRGPHRGV